MSRKFLIIVFCAFSFSLFSTFCQSSTAPVLADEPLVPTFGSGKIEVRIYTDYFCGPCAGLEPKMEQILPDLIKKNKITVTFIDTPVHRQTMLYARYFLFILKEKNEFQYILRTRGVLFEAAKNGINDKENLEEYLRKRKIRFRPFDTKPTYGVLNTYLAQDRVDRTPTCVIYDGDKKGVYRGAQEIIQALELL